MEHDVLNLFIQVDDEDGVNSLFFEYSNGYFSISKIDEDEELYIEFDDQSNGFYSSIDFVQYCYTNGEIEFLFDEELIKKHTIFKKITLYFQPLNNKKFEDFKKVLKNIFPIKFR
jgi:hypothetical protein